MWRSFTVLMGQQAHLIRTTDTPQSPSTGSTDLVPCFAAPLRYAHRHSEASFFFASSTAASSARFLSSAAASWCVLMGSCRCAWISEYAPRSMATCKATLDGEFTESSRGRTVVAQSKPVLHTSSNDCRRPMTAPMRTFISIAPCSMAWGNTPHT